MANTILQSLLSVSTLDIVDEQYGLDVWSDLRVSRCVVTSAAQTAQNPLSNEYVSTSSQTQEAAAADLITTKVIQPVSVDVDVMIESISTAMAVVVAFAVPTKTFTLTAKEIVAQGMSIVKVGIIQSPEVLSAIKVNLVFEQAAIPSTTGYNPSASGDSNTYGIRVQASNDLDATVQSVYNKVSSLWS